VVISQEAPGPVRISDRPRVVVYDPVGWEIPGWSYDIERSILEPRGVELVEPKDEAESDEAIRDADVVIACAIRGQLDAAAIATLRNCVGILCYSIGMNQVDHDAAAAAGIPVTNTPFCVDEVSDHAVMLLLMAERRVLPLANRTADGIWDLSSRPEYKEIHRLRGRTVGIVGAGRIGKEVARKVRVFGYRTVAYDPNVSDAGDADLEMLPLSSVLEQADAVITCADLNPTSRNIVGRDSLRHVRPGTILVNIARGGLVEEEALAEAIRDGRIAIAALDVRAPEPPNPDNDPLAGLPNLILTPHMAGASIEAREALHTMAASASMGLLAAAGRIPAG
jgi:D-3-phosphoglycerate dehydrogenase / 2-oxoglutarate reductase